MDLVILLQQTRKKSMKINGLERINLGTMIPIWTSGRLKNLHRRITLMVLLKIQVFHVFFLSIERNISKKFGLW